MYPLKNWEKLKRGYKFKERTWYSKYHLGLDLIIPKGTPIFAPFNGRIRIMTGIQGGKTIWFYWENKIMRVLHLSKFGKRGEVKKGDIIGYVGNTGSLSKGDHAHIDISKNKVNIYDIKNFMDPEKFDWEDNLINNNKGMIIQKENEPMIYIPVGNKLIKFQTDWPTYAENFKNDTIVKLDKKEFAKFKVVENVTINKYFK